MIKFEEETITITIKSKSLAEDYCCVKKTINNLIIAAAASCDCKTLLDAVCMNNELELSHEQVQKIIDSK